MRKTRRQKARSELTIRSYFSSELAGFYGEDVRTFKKRIEKFKEVLGEKEDGVMWSPKQVELIIRKRGYPGKVSS